MANDQTFDFIRAFENALKNHTRAFVTIDGVVTAINNNFTVDIEVNEVPFTNVPVKVLIGSQASIFEIPVNGSACLVSWRDGFRNTPQIESFDQVDKYYIQPVSNLYISAQQIQFNDGSNGGIPLSENVADQINDVKTQQNEILTILKSIVVPTSTPYPFEPLFSSINDLPPTEQSDIANPDITQ